MSERAGLDELPTHGADVTDTPVVNPVVVSAVPVAREDVVTALARLVLATPGVTGLAPTLSTAGLRALVDRRDTDGIQLISRTDLVEVDINVSTAGTRSARAVAHEIRDRVGAELRSRGSRPGSIAVSVLTIGETPA